MQKIALGIFAALVAVLLIWHGFFHHMDMPISAPELLQYSSEDGVQFLYPSNYVLRSRTEGTPERQWDILVLMDKEDAAHIPENSEGSPVMIVSVFANPEKESLEQWVRGDARSNYKLSRDGSIASTTIGGEPGVTYQFSGLYEFDAVAVEHGDKIFLFEVSWMQTTDQIRRDFGKLMSSVTFTM